MSLVFQCRYVKSCVFRINKNFHSFDVDSKYKQFCLQFPHILTTKESFKKNMRRFIDRYRKKRHIFCLEKEVLLEDYDLESWNKLANDEKLNHTLFDCSVCKLLPSLTETTNLTDLSHNSSLSFSSVANPTLETTILQSPQIIATATTTPSSLSFLSVSANSIPSVTPDQTKTQIKTNSAQIAITPNNVNIFSSPPQSSTPYLSSPLSSLNINIDIPILKRR